MKVLVTGSSGFVGKNFVQRLKDNHVDVVCLDATALGTEDLSTWKYRLGSFTQTTLLADNFKEVESVVHLASESHVDRSILGPREFIDNNVAGTLELFEMCRGLPNLQSIILFGTDEVGACLEEGSFVEKGMPFHCGSVYSASKGAQELLAQAYIKTHGLPIVTTRCVNIFGPQQADEKFIPTVIRKAIKGENIPIYGSGMQKRQWVSVEHVCKFLNDLCTSTMVPPSSVLHITGTKEFPNIMLAHTILSLLGKPASLISHVTDRLGHDARYALGRTDSTDAYGFPEYDESKFMEDLSATVDWYVKHYGELKC